MEVRNGNRESRRIRHYDGYDIKYFEYTRHYFSISDIYHHNGYTKSGEVNLVDIVADLLYAIMYNFNRNSITIMFT